jgi:hypothetical protein
MTHYGNDALQVLLDNYPEYGDIGRDEDVKVCHTTCPAGVDTRNRLGIKNVGGAYLWHCFNCGESGYYRPKESFTKLLEQEKVIITPGSILDWFPKYESFSSEYDDMPTAYRLWLSSYGFDAVECHMLGIRFSNDGVILPTYQGSEVKPGGYQVRTFNAKVKYRTYTVDKFSYLDNDPDTLVIVEDLLSSYKVWLAGYSSLALMGTKVKCKLSELPQHQRVVLWLDSDSAGSKGALDLLRELNPLYPNMTMCFNKQPKECTLDEIRNMIDV